MTESKTKYFMATAELSTIKHETGTARAVSLTNAAIIDIQEVLFDMQKSVGKDTFIHNFKCMEISKEHYDFLMGEE